VPPLSGLYKTLQTKIKPCLQMPPHGAALRCATLFKRAQLHECFALMPAAGMLRLRPC